MPHDNAVMDSFFSPPKQESTRHECFADFDEAGRKLFDDIEVFYNRQRPHGSLAIGRPLNRIDWRVLN